MKKITFLTVLIILMAVFTAKSQTATAPAIGDGTSGNPYQIVTLDNLYWISQNTAEWSKYYVQTANINAGETSTWDAGSGFTPIGNSTTKFTGEYNGTGHTIDSLIINRSSTNAIGLFGYTYGANIDSLGLTNIDISGHENVGAIVGCNDSSSVKNSYSTGNISGSSSYSHTGGLVGANSSSIISNSYSTANVSGSSRVGGLVGRNSSSTVSNSYSTGSVIGTGGLIGLDISSTVSNSFWDIQTSGQTTSAGGTGKTTAEMKDYNTFTDVSTEGLDSAWDFVGNFNNDTGTNDYWCIGGNNGYFAFTWQDSLYSITSSDSITNITSTTVTGNGNILYLGSSNPTAHGFCWNTTGNPDINDNNTDEGLASNTGTFSTSITGLTNGETYYSRAYTTNEYGTFYGNVLEFIAGGAFVITDSVSNIINNSATGYGNITAIGASNPTAYGFCWNTTGNPDINDSISNEGETSNTGTFFTNITGLKLDTTYYAKAYVTNASGTSYGVEINFIATPFLYGSGTEINPYQIATLEDLRCIMNNPSLWDKYYIQTTDINASTTISWDYGNGFSPIGNSTTNFTGEYNGAGHTIDSLFIERSETDYIGLFGYTYGANIDSLGLTNLNITGKDNACGLVGYNYYSTVSNSYITGSISGTNYVGGLIGQNVSSTVSNTYSTGSVTGSNYVGALVGYNYYSTISNSYSTGSVSGTDYVGGFIGYNYYSSTVSNSYSTGSVTGSDEVGGLVGRNYSSSTVSNSYSTGNVTGSTNVGGLVGSNNSPVSNSFWDIETSGQSTSSGGTGKTSAEMKNIVTYTDTANTSGLDSAWDFVGNIYNDTATNNYWGLGTGNNGYPVLIWQSAADSLFSIASSDSITNITTTTVTGKGDIYHLGSSNPTAHGFCWNTTGNPDISDSNTDEGPTSSTGTFITNITGLTTNTNYYARAYVTNEFGTSYGKVLMFIAGVPLVTTDSIINIIDSSAIGYGNITVLSASHPTAYGFCWNTTGNPNILDSISDEGATNNTGMFSTNITGLLSGTIHYAKAYVTNINGTYYGDEISFLVAPMPSGSGTELEPYQIVSLGNLRWLMQNSAEWDKYYIQTADINASATNIWDDSSGFTPIGNNTTKFTGEYNGADHIIDSLYINRPETDIIGLFGRMDGANIDSLGLTNINITGKDNVGGLIGHNYNSSTVSNCYSTGSVTGSQGVGGLIGRNYTSSTINNCYSTVNVNGSDRVGGLVGDNTTSTVNNSYSSGTISGTSSVGGLLGYNATSTVSNSYSSGSIDGTDNVGGLIGYNHNSSIVSNSYSTGNVNGTGNYAGGLVGFNVSSTVSNSYSTGNVTGSTNVGGLVGSNNSPVSNSFWDIETSGQSTSSGGTGKTSAEMKNVLTFTDTTYNTELDSAWDFVGNMCDDTGTNDYWGLGAGNNEYPVLIWQFAADSLFSIASSDSITNINTTTATGNGNILYLGSSNPTAYGFCWNTTGNPDTSDSKTDEGVASSTGTFTTNITGLIIGEKYYSRAYTINEYGTYYGNVLEFGAGGVGLITTDTIYSITDSTAIGYGNITDLGTSNPTAYGFCWNTTGNPDISDNKSDEGAIDTTGAFSTNITGLSSNTTYYAKTYVTNVNGTYYGNEIEFVVIFPSGSGTETDPYQIVSLGNLKWLMENSAEWDKYYIQTADINASATIVWDDSSGFTPIGNNTINFTGHYNGKGHTIDSLYIERPETNHIGLFGYIYYGANIDSLGLTNVNITGSSSVGGLVGCTYYHSTVSNSYSTGSISGTVCVGSLIGYNYNSTVSNSYSTGSVTGTDYVGGLVGYNHHNSTVSDSYSTGSVTGTDYVGGLIGHNYNSSTVSNSFWDTETSGIDSSAGGTGKTTAEMKDYNTFTNVSTAGLDNAWDFVGNFNNDTETNDYWYIGSGNNGYLSFSWQDSLYSIVSSDSIKNITSTTATGNGNILFLGSSNPTAYGFCWNKTGNPDTSDSKTDEGTASSTGTFSTSITGLTEGEAYYVRAYVTNEYGIFYGNDINFVVALVPYGSGTETDPYQISNLNNLYWLMQNSAKWDKYYIQTDDINASVTIAFDNSSGFTPIGNNSIKFTGNYKGVGHTIDSLYIERPETDCIGLFGYTSGAKIDSLGLTNLNITGKDNVGGLVGINYCSTVSNSYSTGSISGDHSVGGLVGFNNYFSTVNNSYSTGSVNGSSYVGGLVGYNYLSIVSNSYSTGSVIGSDFVGGLVGINDNNSTIRNSYSPAIVTGVNNVGGLVGDNVSFSTVNNSYSNGNVSGLSYVGGLVGVNEYSSTVNNSFWDIETSGIDTSAGGIGKTTAEMKTFYNYVDGTEASWDFMGETINGTNDFWGMNPNENNGYPFLAWQGFRNTVCYGILTSSINETACFSYTVPSGDETHILSGVYMDTIPSINGCDSVITINLTIYTVDTSVTQTGTTLTANAGSGATYQWLNCNNLYAIIDGETNQSFTPIVNGNYAVEITEHGCTDTSSCYNVIVGITERISNSFINIYPNPTNNFIVIESEEINIKSIEIINITGKVVKQIIIDGNKTTIDLSDKTKGLYMIRLITNKGIIIKKVMLE